MDGTGLIQCLIYDNVNILQPDENHEDFQPAQECIVFLITLAFVGVVGATPVGCTPGFWKNNPQLWPAEIVPLGNAVLSV